MPETRASRFGASLFLLLATLFLAACSDEMATGPVEIRYGRDTCDFCRMIISDPRYAAQIRGGPKHKAYKFDDIGDAVHFLNLQDWKDDAKVEFWVMDSADAKTWLDARKAHYLRGQPTPMNFGYAAVAEKSEATVSFTEMFDKVRTLGPGARCLPRSGTDISNASGSG